MPDLGGRRVLLGVTGGIAAYKGADLVRRLRELGAEVQVVMTAGGTAFVAPLTFQAVSGRPVRVDLLDPEAEAGMGHIELARWADAVLVAPASADFMARLAHGLAGDLLATLCLATDRPIFLAPAMNRLMWRNPATRANAELLRGRGHRLWGPEEGDQACGEIGPGRMAEPAELARRLAAALAPAAALDGLRVLVTAGPTREALDPVRFLSNRSSGKMGFAIARAAREAGAAVTLVSGPVALADPEGVACLRVESALEMHRAVMARAGGADVFIANAAVADYRPGAPAGRKIKKDRETLSLTLERNPDILAEVARLEPAPFTVGFAAETDCLEDYARHKLRAKGLDLVVANRVGVPGGGFDSDTNAARAFWEGGDRALASAHKSELARHLVALVAERLAAARKVGPAGADETREEATRR